jgi:hypothetical protein
VTSIDTPASVARSTFTAGVAAANVNCGWVGEGECRPQLHLPHPEPLTFASGNAPG